MRQEAPRVAAPVRRGAADHLAGLERAHLAHRQRGLARVVAEGDRLARQVLEDVAVAVELELVVHVRRDEIGLRVDHPAALEAEHLQARVRQLHGHDRAHDAAAHDHRIDRFHFDRRHVISLRPSFNMMCFAKPCASTCACLRLDVENAHRLGAVRLGIVEVVLVGAGGHAGKSDQLPADLVAVAAVHRIGKVAFLGIAPEQVEEELRRTATAGRPRPSRAPSAPRPASPAAAGRKACSYLARQYRVDLAGCRSDRSPAA